MPFVYLRFNLAVMPKPIPGRILRIQILLIYPYVLPLDQDADAGSVLAHANPYTLQHL